MDVKVKAYCWRDGKGVKHLRGSVVSIDKDEFDKLYHTELKSKLEKEK